MGRALLGRLAAAAAAVLLAAPAAPAPVAAARDWSRTVAMTAEGGFRMGNPAARVKLVEYGSLTCGHCAAFSRAGMAGLVATYVRGGRVSYEFRNYILNGLDVAASLVARCGGTARFFPLAEKFYATQGQWMGRMSALSQDRKDQLNALPEARRLGTLADTTGLTQLAAEQGLAPAQAKRCLADRAGVARLDSMHDAAEALGVISTPTFFINGAHIGTQTWSTLEPILRDSVM